MNEEKALGKVEKIVLFFKRVWGRWTAVLIGISIVALFTCSLVFEKNIQLQIINNWIGIILGLVATMASIISLFLSFYNLEREQEETKDNYNLLRDLRETLDEVKRSQIEINKKIEIQAEQTKELRTDLNAVSTKLKPVRINEMPASRTIKMEDLKEIFPEL